MKITQQDMPLVMEKIHTTFDTYWHSDEFQDFSEKDRPYLEDAIDAERGRGKKEGSALSYAFRIRPYPYQEQILDALQAERQIHHRTRNLVVAATGTGKPPLQLLITLALPKIETRKPVFFCGPPGGNPHPIPFRLSSSPPRSRLWGTFRRNFKAKRADHLLSPFKPFSTSVCGKNLIPITMT